MRDQEIRRMSEAESRHWWYSAQRTRILAGLSPLKGVASGSRLLDAGCGTGGLLRDLSRAFPHLDLYGIDVSAVAVAASADADAFVQQGSIMDLPYGSKSFSAVVSNDVLTTQGLDVKRSLSEFRRVLDPKGMLVMNLPAMPRLLSAHDRSVGQNWRVDRAVITRLLSGAGFTVDRIWQWNWLLLPVIIVRRRMASSGALTRDTEVPMRVVNASLGAVLRLEGFLERIGVQPHIGSSLLVRARPS